MELLKKYWIKYDSIMSRIVEKDLGEYKLFQYLLENYETMTEDDANDIVDYLYYNN